MSLAVLLSKNNEVVIYDIDNDRVKKINSKKSTVSDKHIDDYLSKNDLNLKATTDKKIAYKFADYIIVATPTNYDEESKSFDTSSVDHVVQDALHLNKKALVVIKSTLPVGHTKYLQDKFSTDRVIFSPEFLREGQALNDNLYPSRIIIGTKSDTGKEFSQVLVKAAQKENIPTLFIDSTEAEAVKLFANSFLAMRVAFFNELDSYSLVNKLDTKSIIDGVCLDDRIGSGYNNPSFGYGGYCFPKDTKQLLSSYQGIQQNLIGSIVDSNITRKEFTANEIIKLNPKTLGVYRLIMKQGSDNFRSSAILDIISILKNKGIKIIIYEPLFKNSKFEGIQMVNSIQNFKNISDLIIANRFDKDLDDVQSKVFTRDIFRED